MPKKAMGFTPDNSKPSPIVKESVPLATPTIKGNGLPDAIKAPKGVARLGKPAKLTARKPSLNF